MGGVRASTVRTGFAYLDDAAGPIAMAHRGGADHPDLVGRENTLAAFRHAVDLGYTYLETDVQVTRDGALAAFHDNVLDRVTDATGPIASISSADLAQVRIAGTDPVPLLADLLEELPGTRFNIDLKSDAAAPVLAELLSATGAADRVCVGSFSGRRLRQFRLLTGGLVATSAAPGEVAAFLQPSATLARRLTHGRVAALQVPARYGPLPVVTAGVVRRAHAAGAQVHVWTINEVAEMNRLLDLGVDGLITDRTDLLKEVLEDRGLWRDHR